jgi:hypothetical protein
MDPLTCCVERDGRVAQLAGSTPARTGARLTLPERALDVGVRRRARRSDSGDRWHTPTVVNVLVAGNCL